MGAEVPADSLGDEWKGYIVRITGGNDKQGFPMKQGVMHPTRVRLLLSDGHSCYRVRRTGERKRKSVRGCIVGMDLSVLALSIGAIFLLFALIRKSAATQVTSLLYLTPPTTAVMAWVMFREAFSIVGIAGMLLAVIGVALVTRK